MPQEKTPGVYIEEKNAFPNSVVEVPTAVPAFIGYTETAQRGTDDLTNVPTRISSLVEFELYFGGPPNTTFTVKTKDTDGGEKDFEIPLEVTPVVQTHYLLYYGMRLFFDNGGGPCWIVSVGGYGEKPAGKDFDNAWPALVKQQEPTMIVVPDAVLLAKPEWAAVCQKAYKHCTTLGSRIAILDVYDGYKDRTYDDSDVISSNIDPDNPDSGGFRDRIQPEPASYAVAYYPWVNTNIVEAADVDYTWLEKDAREIIAKKLDKDLRVQLNLKEEDKLPVRMEELIKDINADDDTRKKEKENLNRLRDNRNILAPLSKDYSKLMEKVLQAINVMPPSAAIAGVYTRIDNTLGVFKAPANTGIASVLSPTVTISHKDQEDLNVPLDGKAVNAIRTFLGRGVLIWGARTLDGNSQDWRYINVRRTLIMLEQSIKFAAEAYVFAPNNASTWVTVSNMIGNFLNNQWKAGALVGATPAEAYSVAVGLGSTMTGNDILDGYMRVTVKVAVVRPAEFIVITFQQKMQTS